MKHIFPVILIVILLTVLVGLGLTRTGMLPVQASREAGPIDAMFQFHFWAIAFLFALIIGFMLYSMIVFRRRPGEEEEGKYVTGNTGLEVAWTVIPLGVVIFMAIWGAEVLADIRRPDPNALEVRVIGSQWSWQFEYPDYGIKSSELLLPVRQQALLTLTSTDVIHSFWVPEFRVKQDALPGRRDGAGTAGDADGNRGIYTVRCAEVCGTFHAYMNSPVIVTSEENFQVLGGRSIYPDRKTWTRRRRASRSPRTAGAWPATLWMEPTASARPGWTFTVLKKNWQVAGKSQPMKLICGRPFWNPRQTLSPGTRM